MSFTQRDEVIASWLSVVGGAIARRYGCRYLPKLEISEGGIIARCSNQGMSLASIGADSILEVLASEMRREQLPDRITGFSPQLIAVTRRNCDCFQLRSAQR